MPAYSELCLSDAMECLGSMADFASEEPGLPLNSFWGAFVASSLAKEAESGSPRVLSGMCGSELALGVCDETGLGHAFDRSRLRVISDNPVIIYPGCSYWCGWITAYYQWRTGLRFARIFDSLDMDATALLYPAGHQSPMEWFAARADEALAAETAGKTRLKRQRELVGLSQTQLAARSGVGLRAIQQFEQRAKSIARASYGRIAALARALHCRPEDILEDGARADYALAEV